MDWTLLSSIKIADISNPKTRYYGITTKDTIKYFNVIYVETNVLKLNPDIEPDDLPTYPVIGSIADEPRINKLIK